MPLTQSSPVDARESKNAAGRPGPRLTHRHDAVAALDRAGAARLACLELDGGGGRKKGHSEGGEGGEAGEHCRYACGCEG